MRANRVSALVVQILAVKLTLDLQGSDGGADVTKTRKSLADDGDVERAVHRGHGLRDVGGVQVAFWFQARAMCQGAAQAGVRAGRVLGAPAGAGRDAAGAYLAATAGDTVGAARISESRTATTVSVGCSGTALQVMPLPGLPLAVAQSAAGSRERFTHR